MTEVDEAPEHVGRGRGVAVSGDWAEADIVEDDEREAGPATEAAFALRACEAGHLVRYARFVDLLTELHAGRR